MKRDVAVTETTPQDENAPVEEPPMEMVGYIGLDGQVVTFRGKAKPGYLYLKTTGEPFGDPELEVFREYLPGLAAFLSPPPSRRPTCPASISGICLQATSGSPHCDEGECNEAAPSRRGSEQ